MQDEYKYKLYSQNTKHLTARFWVEKPKVAQSGEQLTIASSAVKLKGLKKLNNRGKNKSIDLTQNKNLIVSSYLNNKNKCTKENLYHSKFSTKLANNTDRLNKSKRDYGEKMKVHKYNQCWSNASLMNQRDSQRQYSNRKVKKQIGLLKDMQIQEIERNRSQSFCGKRSSLLANKVMMRKISGTVNHFSTNGYISFENFTKVLYNLKVTKIYGDKASENYVNEINKSNSQVRNSPKDARKSRVRLQRFSEEEGLVKQLWTKLNHYLFNYIDSIILVDILLLLFLNNTK